MTISHKLFPTQANNNYQGSKIAQYAFYLLIALYSFRSFAHFLLDDGGINSIASIIVFPFVEIGVGSGVGSQGTLDPNNVIYLFASLWGSAQIITLFIFYLSLIHI